MTQIPTWLSYTLVCGGGAVLGAVAALGALVSVAYLAARRSKKLRSVK